MTIRALMFFVGCVAAVWTPPAVSQAFTSEQQVGEWMTYYYRKPEPTRVVDAVRFMSAAGYLKNDKAAPPIIGFLAGVLGARLDRARELATELLFLPESEQPVLVLGIWYSGLADAKPILRELLPSLPTQKGHIEHLLANNAPRVTELPQEQGPWVLDALWGFFMATGSEEPVNRIIAVLPWVEVRGDIPRLMVGGAARWSLTSNAVQHDRVLEICKSQLAVQRAEVTVVLKEVIRVAEEERAKGK